MPGRKLRESKPSHDTATACKEQCEPQPPDGGWGWVVAAGVFIIAIMVSTLLPSFGILFSRQLLEWRASSTTTAIIVNTFLVVWRLTGVLLGTLTTEFGFRRVAVTGTLLTATSLTLSSFAASPIHLLFTFSLGCGLGNGLSCVGYLILAHYFKRRRGLANSCLVAGGGMGHFLSPLLIRLLQEQYGVRGATFLLGGIVLHAVLGASVFQPVEWHWKIPKESISPQDPEVLSSLLEPQTNLPETKRVTVKVVSNGKEERHDHVRSVVMSPSSVLPVNTNTVDRTSYLPSIHAPVTAARIEGGSVTTSTRRDKDRGGGGGGGGTCGTLARVVRSVARDMRILRQPTCLIIALAATLVVNAEANFLVMVPFAIQAAGHPLQTAAWCVSIAGVSNLLTRMCVSALSDSHWFSMRLCYMAGMAVMVASMLVFTLQLGVVWQAGIMGVWGCAAGMFYGVNNLLMTRVVGLKRLTSVYSARNLLGALGFFTIGPLVGVIRDVSGSYAVSMWVLAIFMSFSFFLWLLMPAAQAYENRHNPEQRSRRET